GAGHAEAGERIARAVEDRLEPRAAVQVERAAQLEPQHSALLRVVVEQAIGECVEIDVRVESDRLAARGAPAADAVRLGAHARTAELHDEHVAGLALVVDGTLGRTRVSHAAPSAGWRERIGVAERGVVAAFTR